MELVSDRIQRAVNVGLDLSLEDIIFSLKVRLSYFVNDTYLVVFPMLPVLQQSDSDSDSDSDSIKYNEVALYRPVSYITPLPSLPLPSHYSYVCRYSWG